MFDYRLNEVLIGWRFWYLINKCVSNVLLKTRGSSSCYNMNAETWIIHVLSVLQRNKKIQEILHCVCVCVSAINFIQPTPNLRISFYSGGSRGRILELKMVKFKRGKRLFVCRPSTFEMNVHVMSETGSDSVMINVSSAGEWSSDVVLFNRIKANTADRLNTINSDGKSNKDAAVCGLTWLREEDFAEDINKTGNINLSVLGYTCRPQCLTSAAIIKPIEQKLTSDLITSHSTSQNNKRVLVAASENGRNLDSWNIFYRPNWNNSSKM